MLLLNMSKFDLNRLPLVNREHISVAGLVTVSSMSYPLFIFIIMQTVPVRFPLISLTLL